MSRPGKTSSRCLKNAGSIESVSSKRPWVGHSLIIRIRPSRSRIVALISPIFSLTSARTSAWDRCRGPIVREGDVPSSGPSSIWRLSCRASRTHFGHRESVWRGQPSVCLVFSQDFNSGLSDQRGVNDLFGRTLLMRLNTAQALLVASESPFSKYLAAECIVKFLRESWRLPDRATCYSGWVSNCEKEYACQ